MKKYGYVVPCWDCGEAKPRSDYQRSCLLNLQNLCRLCSNRRAKEWREKNPERVKTLNKKAAATRKLKAAEARYEAFPDLITCRSCGKTKSLKEFYLSSLVNYDYTCKPCSNERSNRNRRIKKGLPPPEPRPTLPDWSSF